jgi:hypothetical protein
MIQSKEKNSYFLVKDPQSDPVLIKINKASLRIILYVTPIIFFGSLVSSYFIYEYFSYRLISAKKENREFSKELRVKNKELNAEIKGLKANELQLQKKISLGNIEDDSFGLFGQSLGFQDLSDKNLATIDMKIISVKGGKVNINFGLSNNDSSKRLSGYVFAVQYANNQINIYPQVKEYNSALKIDYFKGESFTISRFKNIETQFQLSSGNQYHYRFLIFSKTGDLLVNKKFGPVDPRQAESSE